MLSRTNAEIPVPPRHGRGDSDRRSGYHPLHERVDEVARGRAREGRISDCKKLSKDGRLVFSYVE